MHSGPRTDIERVRSFNRTVTRRIGVLEDHFLGRRRPFGESRLLYEIGKDGTNVRELRARLRLDSGYVSRLLRSLEAQGLVETVPAPDDARMRRAQLTPNGHKEYDELDRRSDIAARSILSPLPDEQRQKLIAAMTQVEALMRASEISIEAEPADGDAARWCLQQYFKLLDERFEGGYDTSNAAPADSADFSPPNGVFLVARAGGQPVGCGGLKTAAPGVGEIKRLWVAANARGAGLGQRLLNDLEDAGRRLAYTVIRLDTNRSLTEAQALYLKNGYREVPPFNDDPYPDHWFEKKL